MKVLLLFPQKDRQTGLFLVRALDEVGFKVKTIDSRSPMRWRIPLVSKIFRPDLILCNREKGIYRQLYKVRNSTSRPKMICWNLDKKPSVRDFGDTLLALFGLMDILYTTTLGNIAEYRELLPHTEVKLLQQGIDPMTHHREQLTREDHKKYDCDVMFAGDLTDRAHRGRSELIDYIKNAGYDVKVFGGKNAIFDSEHNKACMCAKICLGHNGPKEMSDMALSMSVRDYKVMGAGGVLLTGWCPGIEDWFTCEDSGKPMCFTYKSKEECVDKIAYILNHYDEASELACNAYDEVHQRHRYVDRVRQIVIDTGLHS